MATKVINVMCPLLGFAETFSKKKANMMFTLMFDPCFKGMNCITDHIGGYQVAAIV
jgi:hypothetical protein